MTTQNTVPVSGANTATKKNKQKLSTTTAPGKILVDLLEVFIFIADSGFPFGATLVGGSILVCHKNTGDKEWFRLAPQLEYWLAFKAITNLEKGAYEITLAKHSNNSPYRRTSCLEIVDLQPKEIKPNTKVKTRIATCFGTDAIFFVSETQHDSRA